MNWPQGHAKIWMMVVALVTAGCASDIEDFNTVPELSSVGSALVNTEGDPAMAEVERLSEPAPGWVGGSADFFRDARASKKGDLVTVNIQINDRATLNNTSNRSRNSSADGGLNFKYDVMGIVEANVNGNAEVESNSRSSGRGTTARSETIDLSVAAMVTQVMPNGFLLIQGSQEVVVNFEQRTLHISGLVRPVDISPENTISYEKIAEARIAYGGRGRLTEVQQPGWGQQIWDRISPF